VKIGDGPAAVTGDERCTTVTDQRLGRRSGRMNQESEYLPETTQPLSVDQREGVDTRIHQGIPGSFFMIRGFFLSFREAESKTTGGRTHSSAPLAEVRFSSEERLHRLARNFRQVMGHIPLPCPVCHAVILFAGSILQCLNPVSCGISVIFCCRIFRTRSCCGCVRRTPEGAMRSSRCATLQFHADNRFLR